MADTGKPLCNKEYTDRDYFTLWINNLSEKLNERYKTQQDNIKIAQNVVDIRLESMNEFRGQIKDQTATFVTRKEMELATSALHDKIRLLELSKAELEGKASQSAVTIVGITSVIGLLMSLVNLLFKFIP